jgi:hypothetical protein
MGIGKTISCCDTGYIVEIDVKLLIICAYLCSLNIQTEVAM